jgi:hypothetical protein
MTGITGYDSIKYVINFKSLIRMITNCTFIKDVNERVDNYSTDSNLVNSRPLTAKNKTLNRCTFIK